MGMLRFCVRHRLASSLRAPGRRHLPYLEFRSQELLLVEGFLGVEISGAGFRSKGLETVALLCQAVGRPSCTG